MSKIHHLAAIALVAFSAALPTTVHACFSPSYAIVQDKADVEQGRYHDAIRVRSVNALVLLEGSQKRIVAMEFIVEEGANNIRAGTLVRIIVPDQWLEGCRNLHHPDTVNQNGDIRGYFYPRLDEETGFYRTNLRSEENQELLRKSGQRMSWELVRLAQ